MYKHIFPIGGSFLTFCCLPWQIDWFGTQTMPLLLTSSVNMRRLITIRVPLFDKYYVISFYSKVIGLEKNVYLDNFMIFQILIIMVFPNRLQMTWIPHLPSNLCSWASSFSQVFTIQIFHNSLFLTMNLILEALTIASRAPVLSL